MARPTRRFTADTHSQDLLPRELLTPPEPEELDALTHASEPDPDGFVDRFSITPALTPDGSLR